MEDRTWVLYRISEVDAMKLCFETGIFLFVNESYIIEWSTPEVNKLFGYVSGELDGKLLEILIPPDKREKHRIVFKHFFEHPVDRNMGTEMQQAVFDGYRKDGTTIKVSISLRVKAVEGRKVACAMIFPVMEIK